MTGLVAKPGVRCDRCGIRLIGLQAVWVVKTTGTVADLRVSSDAGRVPVCADGCTGYPHSTRSEEERG